MSRKFNKSTRWAPGVTAATAVSNLQNPVTSSFEASNTSSSQPNAVEEAYLKRAIEKVHGSVISTTTSRHTFQAIMGNLFPAAAVVKYLETDLEYQVHEVLVANALQVCVCVFVEVLKHFWPSQPGVEDSCFVDFVFVRLCECTSFGSIGIDMEAEISAHRELAYSKADV